MGNQIADAFDLFLIETSACIQYASGFGRTFAFLQISVAASVLLFADMDTNVNEELQNAITEYRIQAEARIKDYKKYRQEQRAQLLLNIREEFEESKLYQKLKEKYGELSFNEKRLLKAFPNFHSIEYDDAVIRIKNKLAELKVRK